MFLPARCWLLTLFAVGAASPGSRSRLSAQQAAVDTVRGALALGLRPGARVRVAWPDGAVLSGRLTRRTADSLVVWDGAAEWPVALKGVAGVWEARGHATPAGARAGGLVGGLTGGALGLLFGGAGCEVACGHARTRGAVAGLATGAALGALAGAAVGALLPRWQHVLP
jgi:hypothetical protein